jgi:hypothetical protein
MSEMPIEDSGGPGGKSQKPRSNTLRGAEDLSVYFGTLAAADPSLLQQAQSSLGPNALRLWKEIVRAGEGFPAQMRQILNSVFPSPRAPQSPSRGVRDYESAVAWVAAHAVISRLHECLTAVAREHEFRAPGFAEQDSLGPGSQPHDLLGALTTAATGSDPDNALRFLISREAASRLDMSRATRELMGHVRRHLAVFRTLGEEAQQEKPE